MNCEPPREVQASTNTTIASGHARAANIASTRSIMFGSNAERAVHMSSWPVNPWITYTVGRPRGWSSSTPGGR